MAKPPMRVAIMQPTYLPWIGYFDLIDQVDAFVFLDPVQFVRQSWQQRNRIKTHDGLQWLSVPVAHRFGQRIDEVRIQDPRFRTKHLNALQTNYGRAPFFAEYFPQIRAVLESAGDHLVDLNVALIERLSQCLGASSQFLRASELGASGNRSDLLADLCARLGADEYLSPLGSAAYLLAEVDAFAARGIRVLFHQYVHPEYRQLFPPFASHACVLDLLFNEGPDALAVIRSGRRESVAPDVLAASLPTEEHR